METKRNHFNIASCPVMGVSNGCVNRGQVHAIYKRDGVYVLLHNSDRLCRDEQFIAWNDDFISFRPRQENNIYNGQSLMTYEQMSELVSELNSEKKRNVKKSALKSNDSPYSVARIEALEDCSSYLTELELKVYLSVIQKMEESGESSIHSKTITAGDVKIAGTISTLSRKGFIKCGMRKSRGYISAITPQNHNDFR